MIIVLNIINQENLYLKFKFLSGSFLIHIYIYRILIAMKNMRCNEFFISLFELSARQ